MANKVNVVFSPSGLDLFRLCERRYHYRYNLNKVYNGEKASPLDRGSLIHLALEHYYGSLKQGWKYEACVDTALLKVKEASVNTDLSQDDITKVENTAIEYFDYWRTEDQRFSIIGIEEPFLYLLHEDEAMKVFIDGKIDLIVSDNNYPALPFDHKSMDRDREVFRMSNQFKAYCYALKSNYMIVNKIGFQKTLKSFEKFKRVPVTYDPIILQDWKTNVVLIAKYFLSCMADNEWPMNETSCDKFNRRCEYYEVCDSSGEEAKEFKLNHNYKDGDKGGKVLAMLAEVK